MVLSQIYVWGVFPVKNTLGCLSGRDEYWCSSSIYIRRLRYLTCPIK